MDESVGPRSRRSLLVGAAAAAGALVADAIARPAPAAGASVVLGAANTETSATAFKTTQSSASAKALVGRVLTTITGPSTAGVQGQSDAKNGNGVVGYALNGNGRGVWGRSVNGTGVYGEATASSGVTSGVMGSASSPGGRGVHGVNSAANGTGVYGVANSGTSAIGVLGHSDKGTGVYGDAPGDTGETYGVYGIASAYPRQSGHGYGVYGVGISVGVYGRSPFGPGVEGHSDDWTGVYGTGWFGLIGQGITTGVRGLATANSGATNGVYGQSDSSSGTGVWGKGNTGLTAEGVATGLYASGSVGAYGIGTGTGVYGSGASYGVNGVGTGTGVGIRGNGHTGVSAEGGTYGLAASGTTYGVHGTSGGIGVYGNGDDYGVLGESASGYAGYFSGTVGVSGDFFVNGTKSFLIDHPQDPANRTLTHACVEAPEVLNIYRGTVALNAKGAATIRLPAYFASLNKDYSYQLTPISAAAPSLHVASEIADGRFSIAGGAPGQRVCWQVTGVRNDAWAQAHPMVVERRKSRRDRGRYLNPELFGKPGAAAIHVPPKPPTLQKAPKAPAAPKATKPPVQPNVLGR